VVLPVHGKGAVLVRVQDVMRRVAAAQGLDDRPVLDDLRARVLHDSGRAPLRFAYNSRGRPALKAWRRPLGHRGIVEPEGRPPGRHHARLARTSATERCRPRISIWNRPGRRSRQPYL